MTAASVRWLGYGVMVTLLALGSVGLQRDLGCPMAKTPAVGNTPTVNAPPPPPVRMRMIVGNVVPKRPFRVSCFVRSKAPGQPVALVAPAGLELMPECAAIQFTPPQRPGKYVELIWRLRALRAGVYELQAVAPGYAETALTVTCRDFYPCDF